MESHRIDSNIDCNKTKKATEKSLAQWVACRQKHLNREEQRLLSNVVLKDFSSLPKVQPYHVLESSGICKACLKRGISIKDLPSSFMDWAKVIFNERPSPLPEYDQAPVALEQALLNTAFILSAISTETSFAFLGDDDFHSLLLAKLLPKMSITVFEADIRIVSTIREMAKRESLDVSVVKVDMRDGIPEAYRGQFNAFYSDPPYSEKGIMLFLYWGSILLSERRGSWGILAVPFTTLPLKVREMLLQVQEYLVKNGFLIEDSIPFFKQSPSHLGIISGIMKFQRICVKSISLPTQTNPIYEHFYDS